MVSLKRFAFAAALSIAFFGGGGFACQAGEAELLDFSAPWCGPCRNMEPIVDRLIRAGHPVRKVDVDQNQSLAQQHRVTSIPCFVMLVDGKEVDRIEGAARHEQLERMLQRAKRVQDQAPRARTSASASDGSRLDNQRSSVPPNRLTDGPGPTPRLQRKIRDDPTSAGSVDPNQLLRATARIKVADKNGHSYGTGTIVDSRNGEALILTCGHIFRDSQGKGEITVDLFGPGGPTSVPGRLIHYDLQRDLGFLSFRHEASVGIARIAPRNAHLAAGQRVLNVGCNNGDAPDVRRTHITTVDRYDGPPNIEAAGMPVEGRSGGGLFKQEGYLIGVCFAADSQDDAGLYAGLESVHSELDRLQLSFVAASDSKPPTDQNALAQSITTPSRPAGTTGAADPNSNEADSSRVPFLERGPAAQPLAGPTRSTEPATLKPSEQIALAEIQKRSKGTEVICIIRPADPSEKSEIMVLEDVSSQFVDQLSQARRNGTNRPQLTSMAVPHHPKVRPNFRQTEQEAADSEGWE